MSGSSARHFVITWTRPPASWDPLDFDNAQNLFAARMLYATPIEASSEGELNSRILSAFSVDNGGKRIRFIVKPNLKFEDGSPLGAEDVAFAIARMALVRPKFPVLESIEGLGDWVQSDTPLASFPRGIQVNGDEVIISLTKSEPRPLFRFTLEPFAVIPRRCVDPATNKLSCERAPESGPYKLVSGGLNSNELVFARRTGVQGVPEKIQFTYEPPQPAIGRLARENSGSVVAFANDLDFAEEQLAALRDKHAFLPVAKSWHGRFLLNSHVAPFKERACRQIFAKTFRKRFSSRKNSIHKAEASIFTQLTKGYQDLAALEREASMPDSATRAACLKVIAGSHLRWARRGAEQPMFVEVLEETCRDLGMQCSEEKAAKSAKALLEDGVGLVASSTGFWPLDPLGDLQMLFTPNMHAHLSAIANDPEMQAAIREARATDGAESSLHKINRLLYDNAIYNIYTHHQYFYAGPKSAESVLRLSPLGVTMPYPWQVFR